MRIQHIDIWRYRNIGEAHISCPEDLHILVGQNAQGKTNLLESLYVLSLGKSHRTRHHQELIGFKESSACLKARAMQQGRSISLEMQLTSKGKKMIRNGVEQRRLSEYIGSFPAVLFSPEDLALIKGSPGVRRRFLDIEIGQVSPVYLYHLSQATQLITQRNHLLKQALVQKRPVTQSVFEILNQQFVDASLQVWKRRFRFVDELMRWASEVHACMTDRREALSMEYAPSVPLDFKMSDQEMVSCLWRELEKVQAQELRRGVTLVGPHRDDIRIFINGVDAHAFGSQGQQRCAALSLKLSVLELIRQEMGFYPVLLLDDVLSELDDMRKTELLKRVLGRVQTFVTTTGLEGISLKVLSKARIHEVESGKITTLENPIPMGIV